METGVPLPPPPASAPPAASPTPTARSSYFGPPQPGQLTPLWMVLTALLWVFVFLALTGVWKASQELGLATWWLGPFSDPHSLVVRLLPFYGPCAMVVIALLNVRWVPLAGLAASAVTIAIGIGDLGTVRRLGIVEVAVGCAAVVFTAASFAARYRAPAAPSP